MDAIYYMYLFYVVYVPYHFIYFVRTFITFIHCTDHRHLLALLLSFCASFASSPLHVLIHVSFLGQGLTTAKKAVMCTVFRLGDSQNIRGENRRVNSPFKRQTASVLIYIKAWMIAVDSIPFYRSNKDSPTHDTEILSF